MRHAEIDEEIKDKLRFEGQRLDPVELLYRIREGQSALAALKSDEGSNEGPGKKSFDQFLSQLPKLWHPGEV